MTGNTVVGNGFGGSMPLGRGISTNSGSTLIGNSVTNNVGIGLFMVTSDGYVHNVLNANNGGSPNPQVTGGIQMGPNVCSGAICP